jgi:hypothetical protein
VQYNDYIVDKQKSLRKAISSIGEAVPTNLDSAFILLDKCVKQIEVAIADLQGMPVYKGDSSMRDAAVSLFRFYKEIFSHEYKQILDIRKAGGAETEEGVAKMSAIVDDIGRQEDNYDKTFHNAQKDFADKNHIELTDKKTSTKE